MRIRRHVPVSATILALFAALTLLAACSTTRPAGEQLDDRLIASKVKAKLVGDPEVNPFNLDVDVVEGVVTLTGRVDDEETRDEAVKLARDTAGVREVIDRIRVGTEKKTAGERLDDATITTKIKSKLAANGQLNPFNIDVDTNQGIVTLSGRVATEEDRKMAELFARETKGVKDVRNDLKVGDRTP